ncbi:hypothetical protein [Ornatilinea apprima]|uniref:hypothetical protein n=1 Tax=Ornatilinea apprima TaxID=1134406 RepID=UPI00128EB93D|nr:hypothetical protein [Ornatilinea apprima]
MKTIHPNLFAYLGLLLLLTACSHTDSTPTASAGHNLLYALTFDNDAAFSGWHVGGPGTDYLWLENTQDGKYLFEYPSGFLESQDFEFGDVQIAVDVEFLVKTRVEAGLSCRMQPEAGGRYYFSIANDGHWDIRRWNDGETILAQGRSDAIQTERNRLAARCVGDTLTLLVNDVEIGSAHDGTFVSGGLNFNYAADSAGAGTFDAITVEDWGDSKTSRADSAPEGESTSTQAAALEPATATPLPTSTATPTLIPTPAATLRPTTIPEDELVLYQTGFDDSDTTLSDWKTFAFSMDKKDFVTEGYKTWTANGIFRFEQEANTRVYAIYDKDLGTADMDISARGNPPFEGHGGLGLVCRYSQAGWYQFMVEPRDGAWSIRLVKPDENGRVHFHIISSGLHKWLQQSVELRAECKGDRLTFYIDGEKMASLHDSTFPSGKAGFLGWTFAIGDDWNTVDEFTLRRAQWNETSLSGPAPTPGADGTIYSTDFAKLDDLNPYWAKTDWGIIGIPGSPILIGGPGGQYAPHTYLYINDFDPAADVEISADIHPLYLYRRGLICRYSEDGWYEAYYLKDDIENPIVLLRKQREEQGKFTGADTILGTAYAGSQNPVNLTLTCAGNQISVKLNGEQVLYAEDDTWKNGRYGFVIMDTPPGNLRNTLLNYTVRPAQAIPAGAFVNEKIFNSPDEIAANWGLDLQNNPMVKRNDNVLTLDADDGIGLTSNSDLLENSEMTADVEFLDNGLLYLQCRSESPAHAVFEVRRNGEWFLHWQDREIARGSSPAIQPGKNILTMRCEGERLSLTANGQTIAEETYHAAYTPAKGRIVLWVNAQLRVNSLAIKTFQGSTILTSVPLLNQATLPRAYQPNETIFAWDINSFVFGCGDGWWGRDPNPCWWQKPYNKHVIDQFVTEDAIIVKPNEKILTLFTYQPDLYDLPVEISAEATLTSKGGAAALFCRATPVGRYEFYIQPDGKWYIRRNVISQYYLPQAKHLTTLAHGIVENFSPENMRLSATCSGSDLIFTLNGAELGRAQDTLYPEGQAGLFFDVFSEGSFTNLNLYRAK